VVTGFHPELTGRENIFLNGAILGMTRAEITAKLNEIIEFSGCEMYIDTPVKRYSSGMTVRLAFAVAAHLEPDILVVDEVLAVGDAEFQKKAIGKMQDISKGEGRTVLFVSHDMNSISLLTERVVVLKNGNISFIGDTQEGIKEYLLGVNSTAEYNYKGELSKPKVIQIKINTSLPNNTQEFGKGLSFYFTVHLPFPTNSLALSFQVLDELGSPVTHLWYLDVEENIFREPGEYVFACRLPKTRIYIGNYSLRVHLSDSKSKEKYHFLDSVCNFKVEMIKNYRPDYKWEKGTCRYIEDSEWEIKKL
jgi:lipopolysaccharide transport system ATP-binding protein